MVFFNRTVFQYLLLFLVCVVVLAACNRPERQAKFKIGFSQCTGGDAWRKQMLIAMKGELAFYPEFELEYLDGENSNEKQIRDIASFIKSGVDLLIVSPNEAAPITPIVETAFRQGIPVIIVDRRTSSSFYTAYIGADNYSIGKLAGTYVSELLKGNGSILEIWGRRGSSPAIDRHRGFMETIAGYPHIKIVAQLDGQWELDSAKAQMRKHILDLPAFDLVFAHNDVMAYGASSVCHELLTKSVPLKFIGIDGLPGPGGGIQFVDDKILDATFLYPTGGEEAIRIAGQILNHQPYEKENILHSTVIDSRNVRVMKLQTDKLLNQQRDIVRQQEKINEQIQTYYNQRILIYILLASLIVTIIAGAIAALSWREKNEVNKNLEIKNQEILSQRNTIAEMAEKAEVATQEKLKFFTNISHEFKTPLTLILGPVEELLSKGGEIRSHAKENLQLIRKNAIRLLRLVNQLMDFRKIEDRKMMLKASEGDLIAFVMEVMNAFESVALRRKIDFRLQTEFKQQYVWFDPDMLDKVIFNLLSNAFKFTNDHGKIQVSISLDEMQKHVVIQVEDNGLGMSKEHVEHAFDRFYSGVSIGGTGLGLSLSKEFVELHHGDLLLTSEKGKGTRFSIVLPLGKAHFEEQELVSGKVSWIRNTGYDVLNETPVMNGGSDAEPLVENQKDHTILLIEDNTELRQFLRERLKNTYTIVQAQEGLTGMNLAFEVVPDIIICDIMLPGKDGLEVARMLKNDLRTSHIPVIILTAKGSIEQKIAGVQTGADEYITKPFVFEYLHERIKALIHNREVLRQHYSHDLHVDLGQTAPGSIDKKFVNDFMALIEKNISNAEFNVNDIGRELGMSRIQLYRKVKALLGYSVNDYIINVRLKKAKHLLLNSSLTISEVANEVGFSSPTYFSTSFKAKFNQSPKEFKSSQHS
ncbi:hybrid sensor histidine kinase/response regulator transcription factor [Parachryseolinea silvisoli]|uniref:hybrid sensor histidine kinase/response regulator transcription factor n=1 Tax=Parachryseolinea silvisoli TaxID=2873601 RepID=UPI0022658427|nr:substrate-binding domain-containing protein [Parachryseolinea silvisoli]MCD9017148.1 substrate-binding domain-containing protein [Parachryseolinea silvisoli]